MNADNIVFILDAHLKPLSFRRKGLVWNRRIDGVVEVIDLQVSKSRDAVTVNAGVLDPVVYRKVWGEDAPDIVKEPTSTVRVRIGELLDNRDRWWQLDNDRDIGELVDAVTQVVLPFLHRIRSREEMILWLDRAEVARRRQPAELLGLAVLKDLIGQHSEACELLADQRRRSIGAWHSRYDEVARRLGCITDGTS